MSDTQDRIDKIQQILHLHTLGFLELGGLLSDAEANKDHEKMGYKRMAQFVSGQFNMKPQRFYQIQQVYKLFSYYIITNPDLRGIDFTRLRQLCPLIKPDTPKETVLDYLHRAKTATNRDYIAFIETLKGKPDQLDCEHKETTSITRCKQCGMKIGENHDSKASDSERMSELHRQ